MIEKLRSNVGSVRERIAASAKRSGRSANDVTLVAVTKYVDATVTEALFQAGCEHLGENRPQVLWDKADVIGQPDLKWHLIGHLQRNKMARTAPITSLIHSVDSNRLLNSINSVGVDLGRPIHVLLEAKISGDEAKHGYDEPGLADALEYATSLKYVHVSGLMGMAGLGLEESETRQQFARLRELKEKYASQSSGNIDLKELSMGMSNDFEWAIEEGATIVRVGSLLLEGVLSN
jgi:pyridoxal phosphate enzyme (YggS family)